MQFKDIVGQVEIKQHLINTVKENRISHARLFLGPDGSGSLAMAVAYAQYICCENPSDEDSCGVCPSCRKYSKLIHPDLHFSYPFFARGKEETALTYIEEWREAFLANPYLGLEEWRNQLEAENKQANINIAECHQIIKKLSLKPFESNYKVLIMWLPEYLDKEGNALLKIIEEPPFNTLFLLVAENQDQILNTILSRTQLLKIPRVSDQEVKNFLLTKFSISEEEAARIAYLSDGSIRVAINLTSEETDNNFDLFTGWLRICYGNQGALAIDFAEQVSRMGRENQKNFLRYGVKLMREVIMLLGGAENLIHLPERGMQFVHKFSQKVDIPQVEAVVAELEKAHYHIERNANAKILFLDVSLQIIKILRFNTLPKGTQYIYS